MSGEFLLFLYLLLLLVSSTLVVRKSGRVKQNQKFIAMYQLIEPKGKLEKRESHINKQHKVILLE